MRAKQKKVEQVSVKPVWLDSYDEGVPAHTVVEPYESLTDFLKHCCHIYADRVAISNEGEKITYAELDRLSNKLACWMQQAIKIQPGDKVAIMMPNLLQYPVVLMAILKLGAVVVNVNPLYSPRELEHQLSDSGAKAIIILENFCHTLQQVLPKIGMEHVVVTSIGDMFPKIKAGIVDFVVKKIKRLVPGWNIEQHIKLSEILKDSRYTEPEKAVINREMDAFLQYTGGTTGVSKGALLTHGNMLSNVLQSRDWVSPLSNKNNNLTMVTPLPLYHIFALNTGLFLPFSVGGEAILITNPRDFKGFVKRIKNLRFSCMMGVNTLFNALLNTKGFEDVDFSQFVCTVGGGMAVQEDVAERWLKITGCPVAQGYGLSETSPVITMSPVAFPKFNNSAGLPVPDTEVAIMDNTGHPVPLGEDGEICARGPQVMKEYWGRPDETEKAFYPGGWFRTGDVGHMDEAGYLYIADRMKDMILVSGFNVYPNEVEDVLTHHENIVEAAVVGDKSDDNCEVVKAYIVTNNEELTKQEIIQFCKKSLAAYKVPKEIEFLQELPKTNVGKVLRRALKK